MHIFFNLRKLKSRLGHKIFDPYYNEKTKVKILVLLSFSTLCDSRQEQRILKPSSGRQGAYMTPETLNMYNSATPKLTETILIHLCLKNIL